MSNPLLRAELSSAIWDFCDDQYNGMQDSWPTESDMKNDKGGMVINSLVKIIGIALKRRQHAANKKDDLIKKLKEELAEKKKELREQGQLICFYQEIERFEKSPPRKTRPIKLGVEKSSTSQEVLNAERALIQQHFKVAASEEDVQQVIVPSRFSSGSSQSARKQDSQVPMNLPKPVRYDRLSVDQELAFGFKSAREINKERSDQFGNLSPVASQSILRNAPERDEQDENNPPLPGFPYGIRPIQTTNDTRKESINETLNETITLTFRRDPPFAPEDDDEALPETRVITPETSDLMIGMFCHIHCWEITFCLQLCLFHCRSSVRQ